MSKGEVRPQRDCRKSRHFDAPEDRRYLRRLPLRRLQCLAYWALAMTPICGATHPIYKKLFCSRIGSCRELPHTAPLRRGHWITWEVAPPVNPTNLPDLRLEPTMTRPSTTQSRTRGRYRQVSRKSKGKCWYCGIDFLNAKLTRDHILPRSKGGLNNPSNLVLACEPCNREKDDMTLEIYRRHVQHTRRVDRVVFYGETVARGREYTVKPGTQMRVIRSYEEAVIFARE